MVSSLSFASYSYPTAQASFAEIAATPFRKFVFPGLALEATLQPEPAPIAGKVVANNMAETKTLERISDFKDMGYSPFAGKCADALITRACPSGCKANVNKLSKLF